MFMTEKKASEKWCPHVRCPQYDWEDSPGFMGNACQSDRNPETSQCIGSKCASWRWADNGRIYHKEERDGKVVLSFSDGVDSLKPKGLKDGVTYEKEYVHGSAVTYMLYTLVSESERKGFCGLAGMPVDAVGN